MQRRFLSPCDGSSLYNLMQVISEVGHTKLQGRITRYTFKTLLQLKKSRTGGGILAERQVLPEVPVKDTSTLKLFPRNRLPDSYNQLVLRYLLVYSPADLGHVAPWCGTIRASTRACRRARPNVFEQRRRLVWKTRRERHHKNEEKAHNLGGSQRTKV